MKKHSLAVLALLTLGMLTTVAMARPGGRSPGGGLGGPGGAGGAGGAGSLNGPRSTPSVGGGAAQHPGGGLNGGNFNGANFNGNNFNGGNLHPQAGGLQNLQPGTRPSSGQLNQFLDVRTPTNRNTNIDSRNTNINNRNVTQVNQRQVQAQQVNVNMQPHLNGVFTPNWYGANPNAWQHQYPHADAYAAANWSTAAAWVGIAAAPVAYGYSEPATTYQQTNNYYSDASNQQAAAAPTALANAGDATNTEQGDWLSLGVFGMVPGDHQDATGAVQLSVSKEGVVNGTYLDLLSQAGTPVTGSVDKKSQLAAWKIGDNDKVIFETALSTLTSDNGALTVHYTGKTTQQWQLVRSQQ
jgi:hypothetical protein